MREQRTTNLAAYWRAEFMDAGGSLFGILTGLARAASQT